MSESPYIPAGFIKHKHPFIVTDIQAHTNLCCHPYPDSKRGFCFSRTERAVEDWQFGSA